MTDYHGLNFSQHAQLSKYEAATNCLHMVNHFENLIVSLYDDMDQANLKDDQLEKALLEAQKQMKAVRAHTVRLMFRHYVQRAETQRDNGCHA